MYIRMCISSHMNLLSFCRLYLLLPCPLISQVEVRLYLRCFCNIPAIKIFQIYTQEINVCMYACKCLCEFPAERLRVINKNPTNLYFLHYLVNLAST